MSGNDILSEAIKEAYASAPSDVIIHHTIELSHSAFGSPIRVVQDYVEFQATLESTAPYNANETVTFSPYGFELTLPDINSDPSPSMRLTIDNVNTIILSELDKAVVSTERIRIIYRPYLSTDTTSPHYDPPLSMFLYSVSADIHSITGEARFSNLANIRFPRQIYTGERFPLLR